MQHAELIEDSHDETKILKYGDKRRPKTVIQLTKV